jgi:hypothetical protein
VTCDKPCLLQVQEVLCRPGHVERYFPDSPSAAASIRSTFAQIVSLESISPEFRASVVAHPDMWVLKPQREGGASNLFGSDIADAFSTWDDASLKQYILMERLYSPSFPAVMLRNGQESQLQVLLLLLLLLMMMMMTSTGCVRNRCVRSDAARRGGR